MIPSHDATGSFVTGLLRRALVCAIPWIVVACSSQRPGAETAPTEPPPGGGNEIIESPQPTGGEPIADPATLPPTTTGRAVTLTRIDPPSVRAGNGGRSLDVTLFGTGFSGGAQITLGGAAFATVVVNDLTVTATIPADRLSVPGATPISVLSGVPETRSNELSLVVVDASVALLELSPSSTVARGAGNVAPLTLSVRGGGFDPASVVVFDGTDVTTTFRSTTRVDATVPANLIGGPRRLHVVVRRAAGLTPAAAFTVVSSTGGSSSGGGSSSSGGGETCGNRGRCSDTGMKPGECVGDFPAYRCGSDGCLTLVPGC